MKGYHYIAISSDHVAQLPLGDLQGLFRSTALLLPICQTFGVGFGLWGLMGSRGTSTATWGSVKFVLPAIPPCRNLWTDALRLETLVRGTPHLHDFIGQRLSVSDSV